MQPSDLVSGQERVTELAMLHRILAEAKLAAVHSGLAHAARHGLYEPAAEAEEVKQCSAWQA